MAAIDTLPGLHPGPAGSATRGVAVTPNDNTPLPMVARRLYVGSTGDIKVTLRDDQSSVTLKAVPAGMMLEVWAKQVWATGTTATSIVALA